MTKEELQASLDEIKSYIDGLPKKKQFTVTASCNVNASDEPVVNYQDLQYIYARISDLSERIWGHYNSIHARLDEHEKLHLPKIQSVADMNKILKTLGMDGSYECAKKIIYASTGKAEKIIIEIPVTE